MNRKAERLAQSITEAISGWKSVECVALGEHSESDVLDPYFALVLDVYLRDDPPAVEERQSAFAKSVGQPGAFESSASRSKDRFFIDSLPVRVEYKSVAMIDDVIARCKGPDSQIVWIFKNSGTYMFYRLINSRILYKKSAWAESIRHDLAQLPESFWRRLGEACMAKMEHYLADLGAASFSDDGYFYNVSMAGFIRYSAAALFTANKRFEPSHRYVSAQLRELACLPDNILGRWETLLRSDLDISRNQKYEVAELIARSVLALREDPPRLRTAPAGLRTAASARLFLMHL